jgi:CheY-like chemotaxis protein/two-component sensor histidine kinase
VARIMSGKLQLETGAVDVRETIRRALEMVQPLADTRHIQIAVDADPSIVAIQADGARLQQIVWNLLTNAVKFTPDEGAVQLRVRRAGNGIEIAVSDTGRGIASDFLPFVFEPFRQADGSTTRRHGGLGLGLSIVKHLVEAHGGRVRVESQGENRGSTFTVALPTVVMSTLPEPVRASQSPATDAQPLTGALLDGVRVLVVDDDVESRVIVAEYLKNHRASVVTAASAPEAFELLQRNPPDVLLADIAMPGEDGYSLIRRLRASPSSEIAAIPAAALTAFAREDDRVKARTEGFQAHLSKPVEPRSLVNLVASLSRARVA